MARILAIDDNEDALRLIEAALRANGHELETVKTGAEALDAMERQLPEVVILDLMMPEMTGFEVLAKLRAAPKSARLPVIVLSAKNADEDVLHGYTHGADYYITKPFTRQQLVYGLDLVLGKKPAA